MHYLAYLDPHLISSSRSFEADQILASPQDVLNFLQIFSLYCMYPKDDIIVIYENHFPMSFLNQIFVNSRRHILCVMASFYLSLTLEECITIIGLNICIINVFSPTAQQTSFFQLPLHLTVRKCVSLCTVCFSLPS